MNYIGSKLRLSDWIIETITEKYNNLNPSKPFSQITFAELFAGTGIISRKLKPSVNQIIANDLEPYSSVLLKNYIENTKAIPNERIVFLMEELNNLSIKEQTKGFIYQNYCQGSGSERLYFSDDNGKKIDVIRQKLEEWKSGRGFDSHQLHNAKITDSEYYFLLASLLESADKVANTASVYGAFLKQLKKSAQKNLVLSPAHFPHTENQENKIFREDANTLIKKIKGDILYLDPPYNARQYGANYHLLNTIALYDDFEPKGKTGLREYERSKYCQKNEVETVFEDLIKDADFKFIFVSYNNEGLMNLETIKRIMSKYGSYSLEKTEYQRFKADKDINREHKANATMEYLHILRRY
ncbi:adenine-specific DNA methylase [Bernardetia litoralis DSM 6794]|uniref:site-specific DNA-methyltransferase (adenine-specific) n=1 Tax=Bernardetia litoralis (strain ATCC 23117 / DSM 6794 / NBRC 15988 / NCIMB 1366 / Fx l1 / Sio-4) TaxID=880071 RepID=I4AH02_BERLS|nr:DNA adenine methylase [Bernardetia litoralis]AFM03237.1 adenine-specific DNA methylase [Bernardetia litoralis DSM 6794]